MSAQTKILMLPGLLLACFLCSLPASAATALILDPNQERLEIGPGLEMLEDAEGRLDLAQAASPALEGAWRKNRFGYINVGHTRSAWWFRFKLKKPPNGAPGDWFIEFSKPGVAEIDLYIPQAGGWSLRRTGASRPAGGRDVPFRTYILQLPPDFEQGAYFYIRIQTVLSMNMYLTLWSPAALAERCWMDSLGFGLAFGALLSMLLYNLLVGLFLRDRVYLFYVLYMSSMLIYQIFLFGHASVWWRLPSGVLQTALWAVMGNVWLWATVFTRVFLRTREYAPRLDRLAQAMIIVALAMIIAGLTGHGRLTNVLSNLLSITAPFLGILAGFISLGKGYTPARYYLVAWPLVMVGTVLYALGGVVLPRNFITVYSQVAAVTLEALLLSLALADRIRSLRAEKESLERREHQLVELSIRDGLTGLYNQRYLKGKLAGEVETAHSLGWPLCVLMLDVDNFKRFNDRHGHPEGDKVLARLADTIRESVRNLDTACRYGGEEFTLLLPDTSLKEALAVAERIRTNFSSRRMRPKTGEEVTVTVSIGAAQLQPGETAMKLISRADHALYQAKQAGRDRVWSEAPSPQAGLA